MPDVLMDCRFDALRLQGFTGAIPDMMFDFWGDAGGVGVTTIDRMYSYLLAHTTDPGNDQVNDMWFEFLGLLGYTGHIWDRETQFWCSGGALIIPAGTREVDPGTGLVNRTVDPGTGEVDRTF